MNKLTTRIATYLVIFFILALQGLCAQNSYLNSDQFRKYEQQKGIESFEVKNSCEKASTVSRYKNIPDHFIHARSGPKQRLDSVVNFAWDILNMAWVTSSKDVYIYNSDEKLLSDFKYRWDHTGNQWIPLRYNEYHYYGDGTLSSQLDYYWDEGINQWGTRSQQFIFGYEKENLIFILYYKLDLQLGWVKTGKSEYIYDADNKLLLNLYSYKDGLSNQYIFGSKVEYDYDTAGRQVSDVFYNWIDSSKEWLPSVKDESEYDQFARISSINTFNWKETTNEWIPSGSNKYIYKTSGDLWDEIDYYNWDEMLSKEILSGKDEFVHDLYGNLLRSFVYYWDKSKNEYVLYWNFENVLDYSNPFATLITPITDFTHKITSSLIEVYTNSLLTEQDSVRYYYSEQNATNNSNLTLDKVIVYPNLCHDYFICELNDYGDKAILELYDLFGNVVLRQVIKDKEKISITGFTKGLYIYQVKCGERRSQGKIVIK